MDVVVVEDHGRGHGREEPPYYRVLPGVPVQARVLLEVGDLLARRLARVAPRADELAGTHGDIVGVDLVPQQQQRVRPLLRGLAAHPEGEGVEGVAREPLSAHAAAHGQASLVYGGSCGTETRQEPKARVSLSSGTMVRITGGGRVALLRPHPLAVELDRVLVGRAGLEVRDQDQRVVALDREGVRSVGLVPDEHPDLAGGVVSTQSVASEKPTWRRSGPRMSLGAMFGFLPPRPVVSHDRRAAP